MENFKRKAGRQALAANERQVVAMMRFMHLCGGTLYEEKIPVPGWCMRTAERRGLVKFSLLDGKELVREGHAQIALTDKGRDMLKSLDCLRIGQESDQPGSLRDFDKDFSLILLHGDAGFNKIPYEATYE